MFLKSVVSVISVVLESVVSVVSVVQKSGVSVVFEVLEGVLIEVPVLSGKSAVGVVCLL